MITFHSSGLPFTFTWKEGSDLELMKEEAMLHGLVVTETKESVSSTNGLFRSIGEKEGGGKLFIICQKAIICRYDVDYMLENIHRRVRWRAR